MPILLAFTSGVHRAPVVEPPVHEAMRAGRRSVDELEIVRRDGGGRPRASSTSRDAMNLSFVERRVSSAGMGLSETTASSICIGPTELASGVSGTSKVAESPLASTVASSLCTTPSLSTRTR